MSDVMLETMTGPELDEMYWESVMEDSAFMGALTEETCRCGGRIHPFERSFKIRSTVNALQDAGNEQANQMPGGAR